MKSIAIWMHKQHFSITFYMDEENVSNDLLGSKQDVLEKENSLLKLTHKNQKLILQTL